MKETEAVLKAIAEGLKLMAKGFESVADQVDSLAKNQTKAKAKTTAPKSTAKKATKAPAKKRPVKKVAKKATPKTAAKSKASTPATDVVMSVIQNADGPIGNSNISSKTGYDAKKVANLLFQLKKQGRIKNIERGKYAAA